MQVIQRSKEISVRNTTDVLVIGAGPAGVGAAISAARAGARVTLVEYGGVLGGMWTLGLLSPFFDNANKGGLNREIREKLQERKAWGGLWNISFDPVEMAMLLDELALENQIDLMLCTLATDVVMKGNEIQGVIVENKSGTRVVMANVIIDCTGDGDIAARAGAPFHVGRETDEFTQPMTMMFRIGGLREDYPRDHIRDWFEELVRVVPESGVLAEIPFRNPALIRLPRDGEALVQWTHIYRHSGINGDELTAAMLEGRRQIRKGMEFLRSIRNHIGDVFLLDLPSVIGVRESRRITGEYVISDSDVRTGARFPDGICNVEFNVDIHEPDNEEQTLIRHSGFDVPFRALVPLQIENLLVAGRCISGSHLAQAAYRVTGDCLAMGEAAGVAAAEAVRCHQRVRDLQGETISRILQSFAIRSPFLS